MDSNNISSVGSMATSSADNNLLCTFKPNPKRDISRLEFNRANLYLVFNSDCCGLTRTTGTLLNPVFPKEYFPGVTGGGVYPMGASGEEGGGLDRQQSLFVTPLPFHPVLVLIILF